MVGSASLKVPRGSRQAPPWTKLIMLLEYSKFSPSSFLSGFLECKKKGDGRRGEDWMLH